MASVKSISKKMKDNEPTMLIVRKKASLDHTDSELAEPVEGNCAQDIEATGCPALTDSSAAASENVTLEEMYQSAEGTMPKLRQSKVRDLCMADIMSMITMPTSKGAATVSGFAYSSGFPADGEVLDESRP